MGNPKKPCILLANQQSKNFQLYLSLFICSKLIGFQFKFSPLLIHNFESTQTTQEQFIVENIKARPFFRDAMYNKSKYLRKENFNLDWSKQ